MANKSKQTTLPEIERLDKALVKKLIDYEVLIGKKKLKNTKEIVDIKKSEEEIEKTALEQWKVCVQMAQNTSQRRATSNTVYTALNTAIIGYMYSKEAEFVVKPTIWPIIGTIICIGWINSILYYRDLNTVKYNIIKELEQYIGIKPFICESYASPKLSSWKNELTIPKMFVVGYAVYTGWILLLALQEKSNGLIAQIIRTISEDKVISSLFAAIAVLVMNVFLYKILKQKE